MLQDQRHLVVPDRLPRSSPSILSSSRAGNRPPASSTGDGSNSAAGTSTICASAGEATAPVGVVLPMALRTERGIRAARRVAGACARRRGPGRPGSRDGDPVGDCLTHAARLGDAKCPADARLPQRRARRVVGASASALSVGADARPARTPQTRAHEQPATPPRVRHGTRASPAGEARGRLGTMGRRIRVAGPPTGRRCARGSAAARGAPGSPGRTSRSATP